MHHHHQLRSISLAQKSNLNRMTHAICYILLCTDTQRVCSPCVSNLDSVVLSRLWWKTHDAFRLRFPIKWNVVLFACLDCWMFTDFNQSSFVAGFTHLFRFEWVFNNHRKISEKSSFELIFLIFHREIHMFRTPCETQSPCTVYSWVVDPWSSVVCRMQTEF